MMPWYRVVGTKHPYIIDQSAISGKFPIIQFKVPKRRHNTAFNHHNVLIKPNRPTTSSNTAKMSFLGMGRPQPTSEQKIAAVESEMRMMADTYNRLQQSCQKKCIPNDYREGELNKGESVCLDRCTAKFLDTSMKVSEIMQQQGQALGGGQQGGGGMF
ncbi:Tim10/DDP family zinc finger-domain-containing protein [Fusarium oxysporum II5]|nr:Tim10/DDP family zinc finger-domain-containing protein [Fusarium oxysporum II5]